MLIIGIDPSLTRTSLAIGSSPDDVKLHSVEVRNFPGGIGNRFLRYHSIVNQVKAQLIRYDEPYVILEGYGFLSQKAVDMAEFGSVLRVMLLTYCKEDKLIEVPPKSLKSFTAENGNADKEKMAIAATKRWGMSFAGNHDECDAYCLWRFGRAYFDLDTDLSEKQMEAIRNVKTPAPKIKKRKKKPTAGLI